MNWKKSKSKNEQYYLDVPEIALRLVITQTIPEPIETWAVAFLVNNNQFLFEPDEIIPPATDSIFVNGSIDVAVATAISMYEEFIKEKINQIRKSNFS